MKKFIAILILISIVPSFALAGREFRRVGEAATVQWLDAGNPVALQNIRPVTHVAWIYFVGTGSASTFGRIMDKGGLQQLTTQDDPACTAAAPCRTFGGSVTNTTGSSCFATSSTLISNKWQFIGMTFTAGDGGCRLWYGDLRTPVVQPAVYAIRTADTGSPTSDAGVDTFIGNRAAKDRGFQGTIAYFATWNRVLSKSELTAVQFYGPTAVTNGLIRYFPMTGVQQYEISSYASKQIATTTVTQRKGANPPFKILY